MDTLQKLTLINALSQARIALDNLNLLCKSYDVYPGDADVLYIDLIELNGLIFDKLVEMDEDEEQPLKKEGSDLYKEAEENKLS